MAKRRNPIDRTGSDPIDRYTYKVKNIRVYPTRGFTMWVNQWVGNPSASQPAPGRRLEGPAAGVEASSRSYDQYLASAELLAAAAARG